MGNKTINNQLKKYGLNPKHWNAKNYSQGVIRIQNKENPFFQLEAVLTMHGSIESVRLLSI